MTIKRFWGPWWGGLVAAAALTVPGIARADAPGASWTGLRDHDVILETLAGRRLGGKLVDANATNVALLLPDGTTLAIDRVDIRALRLAGDEALPSYALNRPLGPGEAPPLILRWNQVDPIPPGYHRGTERRLDLIIGGSVLFGAAWVPTAGLSVFGGPLMAIPVVGPFFATPVEGGRDGGFTVLLVIDSVQQAAGLAMFITGLALPRTILRADTLSAKPRWMPVPMTFGRGSMGFGIVGAM